MAMATILTASNFSCPRCRDLTSSLIKSVDAFEFLSTRNEGIPSKLLISAIRSIIMAAAAKNETETSQEPANVNDNKRRNDNESQRQNQENVCSSGTTIANSAIENPSMANGLDFNIDAMNIDTNGRENLPSPQFESDSVPPLVKKAGKRKRPGRPKGFKNKILQLQTNHAQVNLKARFQPRRSRTQPEKMTSTTPVLTPAENEADAESQTVGCHGRRKSNNRPIATNADFDRAADFVKKHVVDTPDGLHYYLYECTQCSQQFPNLAANAQRHIISRHFNKRHVRNSTKMVVQLVPDTTGNMTRPVKVKLYGTPKNISRGGSSKIENRSRVIDINSKKSEIVSDIEKSGTSRMKRRKHEILSSRSASLQSSYSAVSSLINRSIPFPVPPKLTIRNPCANFDLERTMNVRVLVKLTPNLANIRSISLGQGLGQSLNSTTPAATTRDAEMTCNHGHTADKVTEADSNKTEALLQVPKLIPVPEGNSGNQWATSGNDVTNNTGQMLSDVLSDLTEMDEDTIMKMQL